ncbi:unnamed protein product [Protopolystoma xenopodis]|uniref:Uncharacterized protein n=1 Tax=Protopolystoma xenopodis TaxID=117903 RepID=A0A3S5BAC4_9PLAT|nr:unnamed protein product [Protopolystoma xenopodis]
MRCRQDEPDVSTVSLDSETGQRPGLRENEPDTSHSRSADRLNWPVSVEPDSTNQTQASTCQPIMSLQWLSGHQSANHEAAWLAGSRRRRDQWSKGSAVDTSSKTARSAFNQFCVAHILQVLAENLRRRSLW